MVGLGSDSSERIYNWVMVGLGSDSSERIYTDGTVLRGPDVDRHRGCQQAFHS